MPVSVEVVRAKHGQCTLLHYGPEQDPRLVVIDGGPSGVYDAALRPRLEQLRQRHLETELLIDLLCVTRSDDEHLFGLLELTDELLILDRSDEAITFTVDAVWHNPLASLAGVSAESLGRWAKDVGETASTRGLLTSGVHEQRFAQNCEELELRVNRGLELISDSVGPIRGDHGIEVMVFGPRDEKIDTAQEAFAAAQAKRDGKKAELALEVLPAIADLTVLFAVEGRRVLFCGDASGESVDSLCSLADKNGLCDGKLLEVDALRLPQHADAEAVARLLTIVATRHLLVGGDGRHEDPAPDVLRGIAGAAANRPKEVWLAYAPQELLDRERTVQVEEAVAALEAAGIGVHWPTAGAHSAVVEL